jgi:predicted O-methyltransferase YrrM
LAYADAVELTEFKEQIGSLGLVARPYDQLLRAVFLLPSRQSYKATYDFYQTRYVIETRKAKKKPWSQIVSDALKEVDEVHEQLEKSAFAKRFRVVELNPADERFSWLTGAYYLCTGKRVIYAIPLHYVSPSQTETLLSEKGMEVVTPKLIGFTTTDATIVQAFQDKFFQVAEQPSHDLEELRTSLKSMYSKHMVKGDYVMARVQAACSEAGTYLDAVDKFAHDHFGGVCAMKTCLDVLQLDQDSRVLDIGSGFGGPAIHIAAACKSHIDGIELQEDRYQVACELVKGAGLHRKVKIECGDALAKLPLRGDYDAAISFLSILHLPRKRAFLQLIGSSLRTGGMVYIEDYCCSRQLTKDDLAKLQTTIACPSLLHVGEYIRCLELGGVKITDFTDLTDDWQTVAARRAADYTDVTKRDELVRDFGTAAALAGGVEFANGVAELFASGLLIGFRFVGVKRVGSC